MRRRQLCGRGWRRRTGLLLFGEFHRRRGVSRFRVFPIKLGVLTCGNWLIHDETRLDISRVGDVRMPARSKQLSPSDGPLARFALELRRLRNRAPEGRPTSVDKVVAETGKRVSRAAIYSALSGKTLPSRETLAVMVTAWSPGGANDISEWNERRSNYEHALAASTLASIATAELLDVTRAEPGLDARVFGTEMRRLRQEAGLSLGEVARRTNYSKGQISKVENGHSRPSMGLARMLDNVLSTGGALTSILRQQG